MANPQPIDAPPEPSSGKSPEAFRTISEVAAELDLPQHVLRFWETRFTAIRPLKRSGGRRYYRPEDVALLRRIRDLLRDKGYTIKGVQKLLRHHGGEVIAEPIQAADETPKSDHRPTAEVAEPAISTYPTSSTTGGNEDPLLSRTARDDLQDILAELEALRALVKAG